MITVRGMLERTVECVKMVMMTSMLFGLVEEKMVSVLKAYAVLMEYVVEVSIKFDSLLFRRCQLLECCV